MGEFSSSVALYNPSNQVIHTGGHNNKRIDTVFAEGGSFPEEGIWFKPWRVVEIEERVQ
jgi:hypothetical protein